jgi:uncharacterized protein YigA (DUF484 family)
MTGVILGVNAALVVLACALALLAVPVLLHDVVCLTAGAVRAARSRRATSRNVTAALADLESAAARMLESERALLAAIAGADRFDATVMRVHAGVEQVLQVRADTYRGLGRSCPELPVH